MVWRAPSSSRSPPAAPHCFVPAAVTSSTTPPVLPHATSPSLSAAPWWASAANGAFEPRRSLVFENQADVFRGGADTISGGVEGDDEVGRDDGAGHGAAGRRAAAARVGRAGAG